MSHVSLICLQENRHDIRKNFLRFDNVMGKKSVNFSYSNMYFFYLFIYSFFCLFVYLFVCLVFCLFYIPWIIRGKSNLDVGIVNIEMDATRQTRLME